jgi:hypothetical protein
MNVVTQFVSSTCFESHVFIIRKNIYTCIFMVCFSCVYVSSLTVEGSSTSFHLVDCLPKHIKKTACTNGLPDDEHMTFETCRRHELNYNIHLKEYAFCWFTLHNYIFSIKSWVWRVWCVSSRKRPVKPNRLKTVDRPTVSYSECHNFESLHRSRFLCLSQSSGANSETWG